MKNCYDCNHCEVCKWIDEFKDKDVCDFYENGTPLNEVLGKIRAEIEHIPTQIWEENKMTYILASYYKKQVLEIIDKYRKEQKDDI